MEIATLPANIARRTVIDASSCWLWTGGKTRNGYGQAYDPGSKRVWLVHRLAYWLLVGPIPQGLTLDHLCRVRHCVNPSHLEPVTSRVNTLRGVGHSAVNAAKSECVNGHPFDLINTRIRRSGRRDCRICSAERCRQWRVARQALT